MIRSIVLISRTGDKAAWELGREMAAWLEARNVAVALRENDPHAGAHGGRLAALAAGEGGKAPDLLISLGGDGTLLSVARQTIASGVPVVGCNMGNLGFLAELTPTDWAEALETMLASGAMVQERLALGYEVRGADGKHETGVAINDLVVNRGALARLIRLELWGDDDCLGMVRADGLILSTPTGATGYAVSAGGPLLYPDLDVVAVTPICPFQNSLRPLVVHADMRLVIKVLEPAGDIYLTADGQEGVPLVPGDEVVLRRADTRLKLATVRCCTWWQRLRSKGFLGEACPGEDTARGGDA